MKIGRTPAITRPASSFATTTNWTSSPGLIVTGEGVTSTVVSLRSTGTVGLSDEEQAVAKSRQRPAVNLARILGMTTALGMVVERSHSGPGLRRPSTGCRADIVRLSAANHPLIVQAYPAYASPLCPLASGPFAASPSRTVRPGFHCKAGRSARSDRAVAKIRDNLGKPAIQTKKASQPKWLTRFELPLLGSNQDSPDPESGVLPVTPRGKCVLFRRASRRGGTL